MISILFTNPIGLVKQVFFIIVIAAAIFGLYKFLSGRRPGAGEYRSFAKAAKQSKKRIKNRQAPSKQSGSNKVKPLRKRSAAHLTVIEGKRARRRIVRFFNTPMFLKIPLPALARFR
ncbi:SA1362 family protein [Bacillus sp. N9]